MEQSHPMQGAQRIPAIEMPTAANSVDLFIVLNSSGRVERG